MKGCQERGLSSLSRAFRAKAISCERAHVDVSKLIAKRVTAEISVWAGLTPFKFDVSEVSCEKDIKRLLCRG